MPAGDSATITATGVSDTGQTATSVVSIPSAQTEVQCHSHQNTCDYMTVLYQ